MKRIRISTTVKHIEESDNNITLFQIREILSEHRSTLITRILSDLPTYLQFKFNKRVDKEKLVSLRHRLLELSNSIISLDKYDQIVKEILSNQNYHVPSQPFFHEIDLMLDTELNPSGTLAFN